MRTQAFDVVDRDLPAALRQLAETILAQDGIDAVLAPMRSSPGAPVMPTLVSEPGRLVDMDPLTPAFAVNAARVVSRLTRKPSGHRLALMLRPCEIRAVVELVKLNQGSLEDTVVVSMDCLGAMSNTDYLAYTAGDGSAATRRFHEKMLAQPDRIPDDVPLSSACRACDHPFGDGADLEVLLWAVDTGKQILVQARTEKGGEILAGFGGRDADGPADRDTVTAALSRQRTEYRDEMFARTRNATDSLEKLNTYFSACVNCYNCRVACPVCYCRECVFVTDVFEHEPFQYVAWSRRRGALKLPGDTLFYHLTRLAHMSTACVGCGQCSNACPNDIPVMELFSMVARQTQGAFEYQAGMDVSQKPPLTEFHEREFEDVVGLSDG